ncbi:hypothetical protein COHA_005017 [Chlorella ohadii]|uniref:HVA22-like protein n=1 Tax=Chlorella ohadii TaxID=2649997 RepID=A0AAD5H5W4_9CHLO|nr:hypothetical protein COHA_005017 [Chlorella ohadii]
MLGDFTCRIALQVLGYVYPAYRTYKPLLDTFLFWIPFYYEAKLALAVYLWANDLAGAQYVYLRWFQPLVASYEPLVDRRLAESKALTSEWLHSNALRLVAAMQQRALAWLASLQLQAAQAATFFSARSSDLQQQDLKVGLKAFPVLVQGEDSPPRC